MQWTVRNSVSRVQNIKPLSSPCSVCPERPITRSLFSGEMRFMIDIFLPTCYTERASIFRTREKSLKSRNKGKDWKKNEFSSVEYVSVGKGKLKEEISLISFRVPCFLHSLPCSISDYTLTSCSCLCLQRGAQLCTLHVIHVREGSAAKTGLFTLF